MMRNMFLFLLWMTAASLHHQGALAQTCQPWDQHPHFCTQFDFWKASSVYIYVPENQTLAALEGRVATMINYVGSLRAGEGSLASRCNLLWARLNCATYLRPCIHVLGEDGTLKFSEPLQPCQSTCLEYERLCREYVESQNLAFGVGLYYPPHHTVPLTCQENDTDGKPFYQSANYSITSPTNSNETYSTICNGVTSNGTTIVVCEDPLSTVEGTNECAFTCPLPSYTNKQYDALKVLQLVLAWSSWVGSLVVILSYSLHNKLRQFPSNLILMAAIAAHLESVGMILPTFFGYDNTWCGFTTQYLMPESSIEQGLFALHFNLSGLAARSSLCTFQGWLVQTGFLSSTMWWGIVAFNMFLSVFFGKVLPTTKSWIVGLQVVFHVCGWALPAFMMVIPAAADEISFAPGGTFCSIGVTNIFFLVFWAIPIGIVLLVATLLFLASLARLLRLAHQLRELRKTCGTYFRLILFILVYLVLITFIFSYSLRVAAAKDDIEQGYSDYYECLVRRDNNCTLCDSVNNFGLAVLRSIGYSSLGLLLFFTFCFSPSMAQFWWCFLKLIGQGRFSNMFTSDKSLSKELSLHCTTTHVVMTTIGEEEGDDIIP